MCLNGPFWGLSSKEQVGNALADMVTSALMALSVCFSTEHVDILSGAYSR